MEHYKYMQKRNKTIDLFVRNPMLEVYNGKLFYSHHEDEKLYTDELLNELLELNYIRRLKGSDNVYEVTELGIAIINYNGLYDIFNNAFFEVYDINIVTELIGYSFLLIKQLEKRREKYDFCSNGKNRREGDISINA